MARFYILPSRSYVGRQYATLLAEFFPAQHYASADLPDLAESLAASLGGDAHVIFEDDLADDAPLEIVLRRDFGATPADDVIDIRTGMRRNAVWRAAA